jgi:RimJ/RimL family protein N-acetyltransferase
VSPAPAPRWLAPVALEGRHVRLEPLAPSHHADLCGIGLGDEEIWRWNPAPVATPEEMRAYLETAFSWQAAGTALPFVIVAGASGRIAGTTRLANADREHRRVEIGWTWLGAPWRRTPVNTEAKLLLLTHAFETLGCIRVELKTDARNERSRNAILRLGAKEEGTFRNHMITASGRIRHSVWFSVIDAEWPAVKGRLEEKLARPWTEGG